MGKGKKRKNPGVGVDFRKVKHKVGKKLPKAQNDTRTDFQARSINLPNQSITQDKAGAAVSERNLTIKVCVCDIYTGKRLANRLLLYAHCTGDSTIILLTGPSTPHPPCNSPYKFVLLRPLLLARSSQHLSLLPCNPLLLTLPIAPHTPTHRSLCRSCPTTTPPPGVTP